MDRLVPVKHMHLFSKTYWLKLLQLVNGICVCSVSIFVRHEDVEALYGGRDGLDVVKEIVRVSQAILKPNG